MSFDISAMAADETFDVEILNPKTGEPLIGDEGKPCTVTVYGPGSKPFAAAKSAQSNRNIRRIRAKGGKADTTPEEDAAAVASFLTAITVGFNHFTYGGADGQDMFRACYLDAKMGWLTDQVNSGAGDWGNFSKAAPTS